MVLLVGRVSFYFCWGGSFAFSGIVVVSFLKVVSGRASVNFLVEAGEVIFGIINSGCGSFSGVVGMAVSGYYFAEWVFLVISLFLGH